MDEALSIIVDKSTMRTVYRRIFFRKQRWCFALAGLPWLWFITIALHMEDSVCATIEVVTVYPLVAGGFLLGAYLWTMRRARDHITKWGEREISYRVGDDGLHFSSQHGSGTLPWKVMEALWRYDDLWLLFLDRVNCIVLLRTNYRPRSESFLFARFARTAVGYASAAHVVAATGCVAVLSL